MRKALLVAGVLAYYFLALLLFGIGLTYGFSSHGLCVALSLPHCGLGVLGLVCMCRVV